MLLLFVAVVTTHLIIPIEEQARQVLVLGKSNQWSLSQKRLACGAISNKSMYKDVFRSLFDVLSKFLQANTLLKRVTQQLTNKESNSALITTSATGCGMESFCTKIVFVYIWD